MRRNYKKEYGITLKNAKKLVKEKCGYYPRPGREIYVMSRPCKIRSLQGFYYDGIEEIFLQNWGGKLELKGFCRIKRFGED